MLQTNETFNMSVKKTSTIEITKHFEKLIKPPKNNGKRGERGQAVNKEKSLYNSMHRSREQIFNYTIANSWDYWGTLTLDKLKIDRYDLDIIQPRLTKFLDNIKNRKYPKLQWLIVPEQHKDKAWHFHLLLNGIPVEAMRDTGRTYKDTKRKMYNWIEYENKYGLNSFIGLQNIAIEEQYKISNYLTKYITKQFCKARENKKKYWSSRTLETPTKTNTLLTYDEYIEVVKYNTSSNSIYENVYNIKNRDTGEIQNTIIETVKYNLGF